MLLGELDLNAGPAVGALGRLDAKFKGTTSGLSSLGSKLSGLAAGFVSLSAALAGVKASLNLGGTLHDMSLRTGESVENLVKLRQAFEESGLGAEGLEPFLLKLDNALGGINDEGGKTSDAFDALGTSAEELSRMDAAGKLQTIQKGLAGIADQGSRVQVMRNLFGKSGGQMLSLFGDKGGLEQGGKHAAALAAVAQRAAPSIDALGDALSGASLHVHEFFFGALEKIAPELTKLVDGFGKINFVEIGSGFASLVTPIIMATKAMSGMVMMISAAAEAIAQFTMGDRPPEYSAPSERALRGHAERKRAKQGLDSAISGGGGAPVSDLQKRGLGDYGPGAGRSDPILTEAREHTRIWLRIESHLRTGGLRTGGINTGRIQGPSVA